jgi:CheY-like chemotaxis protein
MAGWSTMMWFCVMAAVLQEHGYHVTTAESVPEALKLITAGSYDISYARLAGRLRGKP